MSEEMIDAALAVLYEEWTPPFGTRSRDFIQSPESPPPGPERDEALAALRAADDEADRLTRDLIRRTLIAALTTPPVPAGLDENNDE